LADNLLEQNASLKVLQQIGTNFSRDPFWHVHIENYLAERSFSKSLHLAILVEPYLEFILSHRKTIESRFSVRRIPPYYGASEGDIILLKRSGGPIVGLCQIAQVNRYSLTPSVMEMLKTQFSRDLCAEDPGFWKERENMLFATLMTLQNVVPTPPIGFNKRDRRGWVVLQSASDQLELDLTQS
jgi:hypothetical protein